MSLNWYLLKTTGSMTKANTYVRKFTEGSERSGVLNMTSSMPRNTKIAKTSVTIPIPEPDRPSIVSTSSRRSKRWSNRSVQLKEPKNSQTLESCPLHSCPMHQKPPVDSPQMLKFFNEVRQRELRDYYIQMKSAERSPEASLLCPCCGLPKRDKRDLTHNIYCTGNKSLRRDMNINSDRYRDLNWLWNSTVACPQSA
ncbi:uncharacterized protein LOC108090274 [Drosophila ficusphila]|uniref:uncharacterized protein LOC108090274 n=1 Tax=Drosophila ficusphila TaxID=30025 RepID=UPI0007E7046E|nr:uncharacterized protein LOC108090274 [Drosophila ficusphila]